MFVYFFCLQAVTHLYVRFLFIHAGLFVIQFEGCFLLLNVCLCSFFCPLWAVVFRWITL